MRRQQSVTDGLATRSAGNRRVSLRSAPGMAADRQHLEIWPERDMTDLLDQLHETPAIPLTQPTSLGPGPGVEPPPGLKEPRLGMPELAGSSLLAWCRDHAISLVTVAGLMLLTGLVIGAGITHYPSFGDDEGTYV
jgi:hypothetical protein